jgi:mannose-6-phosphate isomerase-like protein (cupin superfamily)
MNYLRVKAVVIVFVFVYLAGGIFVSGCSMNGNEGIAMSSGKPLVIELNNNPEYQPLLGGVPQTCGMRSGRVYLKSGEACGQHSTKNHEEVLVFLSGKGTALIGEKEVSLAVGQGKICYIPPDTLHNIKNTGAEPLVYIYCVAPVNPAGGEHHLQDEHNHVH